MGQGERLSRRSVLDHAKAAVDLANTCLSQVRDCTKAVNAQAKAQDDFAKEVEQERIADRRRLTAAVARLDARDRELSQHLECLLFATFRDRLRWLFTGQVGPTRDARRGQVGRGMVSGETPGRATNPHETPRPTTR